MANWVKGQKSSRSKALSVKIPSGVDNGDRIRLSTSKGESELLVDDTELASRRANW